MAATSKPLREKVKKLGHKFGEGTKIYAQEQAKSMGKHPTKGSPTASMKGNKSKNNIKKAVANITGKPIKGIRKSSIERMKK